MKKTTAMIIVMSVIITMAVIASSCSAGRGGCYATRHLSGYGH